MAPRSLFFMAIAIASAAMGASFAVTKRLDPQASAPAIQAIQFPDPVVVAAASPQPMASPLFAPPPIVSPSNAAAPVAHTNSTDELLQVKNQIRRAIRERNTVLLRSLLQASSVREMLRTVETPDPMNLDNLDASTWRILEKAIAHRCRQPQPGVDAPSSELCFE